MKEKKAAVISGDSLLLTLAKCELLLLDFDIDEYQTIPKSLDGYDVVVLDGKDEALFPTCNAKIKLSVRNALSGATDTIDFPFLLEEFRKKVTVGVKESTPTVQKTAENVIFSDKKSLTVRLLGTSVKLSQSEFIILEALCKKNGEYIPLSELNSMLGAVGGNIAAVYVCHLRRKLEAPLGIRLIFTSGGKGYMTKFVMK